jgi:hypothetical protein
MKLMALLVGVLIAVIGLVSVIVPHALIEFGQYFISPMGLYIAAALRVGIGVVLIKVSSASRTPRILRVFGIIAAVAGITTPLVGVDRARAIMQWSTQAPGLIRLWAVLALVLGGFITYSIAAGRHPES